MLDTPEAAAGEVRDLRLHGLAFGRQRGTLLVELQGCRVEAVALAGGWRTVVEHVSEVRTAAGAVDLRADHAVTVIHVTRDVLGIDRLIEARPAGARMELVLAGEQRQPADHAAVGALFLVVEQRAAERGLGVRLLRDTVGVRVELAGQPLYLVARQGGNVVLGL